MKSRKRVLSCILAFALVVSSLMISSESEAAKKKKVKLNKTKLSLYVGKTYTLKLKNNKKKIKWSTSNKKVATVSSKGKVKARKKGSATITAKVGKKKYKCKVTVKVKKKAATKKPVVTQKPTQASAQTTNPTPTPYVPAQSFTLSSTPTELQLGLWDADYDADEICPLDVTVSPNNATEKVKFTMSDPDLAYVDSNYNFIPTGVGTVKVTASIANGQKKEFTITITRTAEPALHDPSVYRDPVTNKYYSFGSHCVGATSTSLVGWAENGGGYAGSTWFKSKDWYTELKEVFDYTQPGATKAEIDSKVWAPDIIYNKAMKKYCMYITVAGNGAAGQCAIAMLSSDKPTTDYEYQGIICCSGIQTTDYDKTNLAEALGMTSDQAKNSKYTKLGKNSPDCIDATVLYDHNGNLWMVYGSFTTLGGIRLLRLDPNTGLRGKNYEDSGEGTTTTLSECDPYYGKRIANNNGEGPYIQEVKSSKSPTGYYYFLWTSVGGLFSQGGYNMRLVRATSIEGPYYDPKGQAATSSVGRAELGLRVMDNYQFSHMDYAYTSCGGNSATDDGKGKTFIHFHQKFSNGSQNFKIRTNQTFLNEDGWLVTAPYDYNGETIKASYAKEAVVGEYEFLHHRTEYIQYSSTSKVYDYIKSQRVVLNNDGTISGAKTGTWSLNGHYITMKIGNVEYKGVVVEQYENSKQRDKVMTFTLIGPDNRTIWGSKMHKTDKEAVEYDAGELTVPKSADEAFDLTNMGLFGSAVTWTSSDKKVISIANGKATVTKPDANTNVTLTATVTKGTEKKQVTFVVAVSAYEISLPSLIRSNMILSLPSTTPIGTSVAWTSDNNEVINATTGQVTKPAEGSVVVKLTAKYGTVTKNFTVTVSSGVIDSYIYQQNFESLTSDAALRELWVSANAAEKVTLGSDATHGKYMSYSFKGDSSTNSRGMKTNFGVQGQTTGVYCVEFDARLKAGNNQDSNFVLTGSDFKTISNNANYAAESGYIMNLTAAPNATNWAINGKDTVTINPDLWAHFTVSVDPASKVATIVIEQDSREIYSGNVTVNGAGTLGGMHIVAGRYQAEFGVDNISVY